MEGAADVAAAEEVGATDEEAAAARATMLKRTKTRESIVDVELEDERRAEGAGNRRGDLTNLCLESGPFYTLKGRAGSPRIASVFAVNIDGRTLVRRALLQFPPQSCFDYSVRNVRTAEGTSVLRNVV